MVIKIVSQRDRQITCLNKKKTIYLLPPMAKTVMSEWMTRQRSAATAVFYIVLENVVGKNRRGIFWLHYSTLDILEGLHTLLMTSPEDFVDAIVQEKSHRVSYFAKRFVRCLICSKKHCLYHVVFAVDYHTTR